MPIRTGPSRRLLSLLFLLALAWEFGAARLVFGADAPAKQGAVPAELQAAIRALETKDGEDDDVAAQRRAVQYEIIRQKGDARLVPALRAFHDGLLQDVDGHLVIYGSLETLPDGQKAFPLLDAFTNEQLKNPDGSKSYFIHDKVPSSDDPGMMRAPQKEHKDVSDLISSLALLDPDDEKRIESITDTGDKANHALYSSEWGRTLMGGLDRDATSLRAEVLRNSIPSGAAAMPAATQASRVFVTTLPTAATTQIAQVAAVTTPATAASTPAAAPVSEAAKAALVDSCNKALGAIAAIRREFDVTTAARERFLPSLSVLSSALHDAVKKANDTDDPAKQALAGIEKPVTDFQDALETQHKMREEIEKVRPILATHLSNEHSKKFQRYLNESIARIDLVIGKPADKIAAAKMLADIGTTRGEGTMTHALENAVFDKDNDLEAALRNALEKVESYQAKVHFAQNSFAGLSTGSILILLALGLSIIFGLMGVINMAHGEFMMVGAFATWGVSEAFKAYFPHYFEYYLIGAIPASFLAAALAGWVCEFVVVRHLYGRPLDTLLATWGIGLILIWAARKNFGDNMHISPPHWLEGGVEVAPDLFLARNRMFIVLYCFACVSFVYFIVNWTKLGLLLRATTQNRQMASALGVGTRRVDAFTFAMGTGLAGLAGVAVTMVDKINPNMGGDVVVDSFMVVVVGGVGKLAGAIFAGAGLGFVTKYLEPILGSIKATASGASVFTKVFVLCAIVTFLQWRPQGLFPPKGRMADA